MRYKGETMKLIVAVARDWGIGNKGELLFNVPQDMDFFKKTTSKNKLKRGIRAAP